MGKLFGFFFGHCIDDIPVISQVKGNFGRNENILQQFVFSFLIGGIFIIETVNPGGKSKAALQFVCRYGVFGMLQIVCGLPVFPPMSGGSFHDGADTFGVVGGKSVFGYGFTQAGVHI